MKVDEPIERTKPVSGGNSRTAHRRRINLIRASIVALITSVVLIFFIVWYRAYPQKVDCFRMSQRLVGALEEYREKNKTLPTSLDTLPIKPGRYDLNHFEYFFNGLGGPDHLPDDTFIAWCASPHRSLFEEPWRSVILFEKGRIVLKTLPEKQFQTLRSQMPPPDKF